MIDWWLMEMVPAEVRVFASERVNAPPVDASDKSPEVTVERSALTFIAALWLTKARLPAVADHAVVTVIVMIPVAVIVACWDATECALIVIVPDAATVWTACDSVNTPVAPSVLAAIARFLLASATVTSEWSVTPLDVLETERSPDAVHGPVIVSSPPDAKVAAPDATVA